MGKGGNASAGGQATAKAKAEPAAKDGGKKGDGKTSKVKAPWQTDVQTRAIEKTSGNHNRRRQG